MILNYTNEVTTEVTIDDTSWYTIKIDRMKMPEGEKPTFTIDVHYHLDDGSNDNTPTVVLVGGTMFVSGVENEHLLILTRNEAMQDYNLILRELLALVHLGREPKSPYLTGIQDYDKLEATRKELEDIWVTVIE